MGSRRTFTKEFKAEAVALVKQQGLSVNKAAKDLGVTWSQIDNWVKRYEADNGQRPEMLTSEERSELMALRKQNRILTVEREILKCAPSWPERFLLVAKATGIQA
jgi:transposase